MGLLYIDRRRTGSWRIAPARALREEYRVLEAYVARNENTILVTGTIFVAGSLVLLGESARTCEQNSRLPIVLGVWAIYSIWLFFIQLLGYRIQSRAYGRLRDIEDTLQFEAHGYLLRQRDMLRRWVWLALLNAFILFGSSLIETELPVIWLSLMAQIVFLFTYSVFTADC